MALRVTSEVSITRSAQVYAPTSVRPALLLDLATKESLRVQPREESDVLEPLPPSNYWKHVATQIKDKLGADTQVMWSVNQTPGVWVSFELNDDQYWLVFEREQLAHTDGIDWLGSGGTALRLAPSDAPVRVLFVNAPLAELAQEDHHLPPDETPRPL